MSKQIVDLQVIFLSTPYGVENGIPRMDTKALRTRRFVAEVFKSGCMSSVGEKSFKHGVCTSLQLIHENSGDRKTWTNTGHVPSKQNMIYGPFWNTGTRKACSVTVHFRYLQLHTLVQPYSALPAAQTCSTWITTPRCWNSSWSTELVANLWHGRESHYSLTTLSSGSQANPTVYASLW